MNNSDFLFEISSETCQKFGGIYTVISSKTNFALENFKNYFLMGIYCENTKKEFVETSIPDEFKEKVLEISNLGIKVHFGYWNINEKPKVILVEYLDFASNINDIKSKLWENYNIDSLDSYWYDFDEMILWSWCCGVVIEKLTCDTENNVFVHSHEWMSGGAIFYLDMLKINKFKTVFTTHATMLGRTICGVGENVYEVLDKIDVNAKSYELKVHTKQQTEKALANISNCFTTVSEITANEAKAFYEKEPDVLLYNGMENYDFDHFEKGNIFTFRSRKKMNFFLKKYFGDFYDFDIENSKIFYTSGRNEFRNKGIDLYLDSLKLLNDKLKKDKKSKEVINLILIPIGDFAVDKRFFENFEIQKSDFAPISTHYIPDNNEIIKKCHDIGLNNHKDDKVKVVVMPFYLDGENGLIDMKYYDTICGLDLGIFASFYEPWGYTPLESIAYAVPTVTSDLSGFGRAINRDFKGKSKSVYILKRDKTSYDKSVNDLYKYLLDFSKLDDKKLIALKKDSIKFSKNFSWRSFYNNYLKAYEIASKK